MTHSMMKFWIEKGWASWNNQEESEILIFNWDGGDPAIVRLRPDLPSLPVVQKSH